MAAPPKMHVRFAVQIKAQDIEALAPMRVTVSEAAHLVLVRLAKANQMSFALKAPIAETPTAMTEANEINHRHHTRFSSPAEMLNDLERNTQQ